VEDLLTSDANLVAHHSIPTYAPLLGHVPRQSSGTAAGPQRAQGQASSLGPYPARRPGQPYPQEVQSNALRSLHDMSNAPSGQTGRRAPPPNISIPAPLDVQAETQMAFRSPHPRHPDMSGLVTSLEHAATTHSRRVVHGLQNEMQFITNKL
jgi:hypothetical protein